MANQSSQSGYALVVLLVSISVAILSFSFVLSSVSKNSWYTLSRDAFQLNKERSRLIYYAVDYVNLYGSGGAGPGHLPCPDTDPDTQTEEGSRRPGPNPPCGSASVVSGKLPDGVTRSAGRIALSDSLFKRSEYRLSRGLVNNPALVLNVTQWPPETFLGFAGLESIRRDSTSAESTSVESAGVGYAALKRPSGQTRILSAKQLKEPTFRWVRAWLAWRMLETPLNHCQRIKEARLPYVIATGSRLFAVCPMNPANVVADKPVEVLGNDYDKPPESKPGNKPCELEDHLCTLSNDRLLSWLTKGDLNREDLTRWQDTPFANHWFVKNHWDESTRLYAHADCLKRTISCALYIDDAEKLLVYRLLPDDYLRSGQ